MQHPSVSRNRSAASTLFGSVRRHSAMSWIPPQLRHAMNRLLFRSTWSRLEIEDVARRFGDPRSLNDYMQACFEYVSDEDHHGIEDHWQVPDHTHRVLRGDCEDYAVFAHHVLGLAGYESRVLCLFTAEEGHALCVVLERRTLVTLCNEGLREIDRPSGSNGLCEDAARRVASRVYPGRWESCSYVNAAALADLIAGDVARPFDPRYELIMPD